MRKYFARRLGMAIKANGEGWSDGMFKKMFENSATQAKIDRRNLLKQAAGGIALTACGTPRLTEATLSGGFEGRGSGTSNPPTIVILGSGLAGMTAAYELQKQNLGCTIFESRERTGGRVCTKHGFNQDNMFIELGAEFIDSVHSDLITLAQDLDVEIESYTQQLSHLEDEVYFFNKQVIDSQRFLGDFRRLASLVLQDTQKIRHNQQIITPVPGHLGPSPWLDKISLADYLASKQKDGLSQEFVDLINVMYLGMMGLETSEQNTYNLLTLMDPYSSSMALYGDSDESKRVKGGNGNLADALAVAVERRSPVKLGHRLVHIKDLGSHFVLTFDRSGNGPLEVKADIVVNTIPIPVLTTIDGMSNLSLSLAKQNAIKELGYATNAKFTIGFKDRRWRSPGNRVPPNYGTVWTNGLFPEVRDSSNHQKGRSGIILNYLGGSVGRNIPSNLIEKTLDHLESMYPGIRNIHDGRTNLQHWTSDPFAKGSYICPKPGHYASMGGFEKQVELGGRMIFAGDSLSKDFGGYMNGAIETGKKAAAFVIEGRKKKTEVF
jgi:monoamine oxidase